jgi:hypothetical protein
MCLICQRRGFLVGGISTLLFGIINPSVAVSEIPTACGWTSFDVAEYPTKSKSADPNLDRALIKEIERLLAIIPVNPGFQYIEERSPNAFAIRQSIVPGTKGTILLGLKLIEVLMKRPNGGAAVAGVCAHECGHIFQYFSGYAENFASSDVGHVLSELHADLIAGYYMGKRRLVTADNVRLFSAVLVESGTYDFGDPKFHGSPGLRAASMERGYFMATTGIKFEEAARQGEEYVRRIFVKP